MDKRNKFWFSSKQKYVRMQHTKPTIYMIFDNGDISEYTEMRPIDSDSPYGVWDDYEYIGEGKYLGQNFSKDALEAMSKKRS